MRNFNFLLIILLTGIQLYAQPKLQCAPLIGKVEMNSALLVLSPSTGIDSIKINYWYKESSKIKTVNQLHSAHDTSQIQIRLSDLIANREYEFEVYINENKYQPGHSMHFKTAPEKGIKENFTFMLGSCLYLKDESDVVKKASADPAILIKMAEMPADFMLWTGDNVYLRPEDCRKASRMRQRYTQTRQTPELQKLISTRANLAVWDDHDFGPDNSFSEYALADTSLKIFQEFWANGSYGVESVSGIFSSFTRGDCEFFLMDDRYYRSMDTIFKPSHPDSDTKSFFGDVQLKWLKNNLKMSTSTFKFIVSGSQMLNEHAEKECFYYFSKEYYDLMKFIKTNKIEGVVFLSGDRHFTELIKIKQKNSYPLYELTCSPLTSLARDVGKTSEINNPLRVANTLVIDNNFATIEVKGNKERKIIIKTFDKKGKQIWEYDISEKELKF